MRELGIACGASRQATTWRNMTVSFDRLKSRLKHTFRTPETAEEYAGMSKADRDQAKDHGGFVGGILKDGCRKAGAVESRSMITLDGDRADPAFLDSIQTGNEFRITVILLTNRDTSVFHRVHFPKLIELFPV